MAKMLRDETGRFTGAEMDPKIKRMIDQEQEDVKVLLNIAELLKVGPETVGLRKGPSGEYIVSYWAALMFMLERRTVEAA